MANYLALLRKEPNSDFGVDFPDFPGCVTAGTTLDEARSLAEEALAFHIEGMLEDGEPLPQPSTLEAVMSMPDNQDSVAFLVAVADPPSRHVRVNITLPEHTLKRIDAWAKRRGVSRSAFLAEAAMKEIGHA